MPWVDVAASSTGVYATNGRGGVSSTAVSTFTAATIFAPTGAATAGAWPAGDFVGAAAASTIDGAWGGGGLTPAVGDMIFDRQGGTLVAWAIITKITADAVTIAGPTTYDIIEVDRWRKWGYPDSTVAPGTGGLVAGDDMGLFRGVFTGPNESIVIDSIEIRVPAAVNLTINDINATAVKTITCVAAVSPFVYPCTTPGTDDGGGTRGWEINGPFSVTTGAGLAATVNFRVVSKR